MATLAELGTYLQAQGVGTRATDIWEGILPDEADDAADPDLFLLLYGSWQPPEHDLGQETTRLEFPAVQVLCRGTVFADVQTMITDAFEELVKIGGRETLSGVAYLAIEAQQQPYQIEIDTRRRWVWGFNVYITKEPS